MVNNNREKMINMIIYFLKNTKRCGKTKLFKLLYFADFKHFKQTGKSISGLEYYAWDRGPVPVTLFEEFKNPPKDLSECFIIPTKKELEQNQEEDYQFFELKCRKKFDDKCFSERELKILEEISFIYKEACAKDMIEVSHLKNQPWDKTYREKGILEKIDFFLAIDNTIDSLSKEVAKERFEEIEEMKKIFG